MQLPAAQHVAAVLRADGRSVVNNSSLRPIGTASVLLLHLLSVSDILDVWRAAMTRSSVFWTSRRKSEAASGSRSWAQRVPADIDRPHGVSYSLTLHEPSGRRVFGIDNAHPVQSRRGPSGRRSAARDHLHRDESVRPYAYRGAESVLEDFWREVDAILKKRGIE